jgi:hypothetical protein
VATGTAAPLSAGERSRLDTYESASHLSARVDEIESLGLDCYVIYHISFTYRPPGILNPFSHEAVFPTSFAFEVLFIR